MALPAVLPSVTCHGVGTLIAIISQLNTLPACAPVNASMATLRLATHDSGSGWFAIPFLYDSFIHNSTPVYPGARHGLLAMPRDSGVWKLISVLVAEGDRWSVYGSVKEVPGALRQKLARSTSSGNAATLLIADARGREELRKSRGWAPEAPPCPRPAHAALAQGIIAMLLAGVCLYVLVWR